MMQQLDLQTRSYGRGGWGVVDATGALKAGPYNCEYTAIMAIARLERQVRQRRRACLCCSASFLSDGPHNRLCNSCRRQDTGLG